jgi:hypothetical protein
MVKLNNLALLKLVLLCLALMQLSACSQRLVRDTCVKLAEEVNYCLTPLSELNAKGLSSNQAVSLSQMVSFTHDQQQHELMTQLEIVGQQMTLVGLAPLGQALFTVVYDGHTITSQQSQFMGDQFKAEYLMAIMQLAYWSTESINRQLSAGKLINESHGLGLKKRLVHQDKPIIELTYNQANPWEADVTIDIRAAKIQLHIVPLK